MCEERREGAHGAEGSSIKSPECGLVCGELLDMRAQQKWSELLALAYLARSRELPDCPGRLRNAAAYPNATQPPIFPILSSLPIYLN